MEIAGSIKTVLNEVLVDKTKDSHLEEVTRVVIAIIKFYCRLQQMAIVEDLIHGLGYSWIGRSIASANRFSGEKRPSPSCGEFVQQPLRCRRV